MNIILTGSTGFVGINLKKFLINNNIHVSSISLRNESFRSELNPIADAIIHLAGKAHDTSSKNSNEEEYFAVNRDLTIDLFEAFIKSDIRDFFYFSSIKAVADSVDDVLDENYVCNPKTPYGKSKLEAEKYLLQKELPKGKRIFIIRPCMIHGPGNKGNLNLLYNVVKKNIPWPLASFKNSRSFLSIGNLNFLVHKMLITSSIKSGIYNFADDGSLSTNELVKLIAKSLNKQAKFISIPKKVISFLARIGDNFPLPINSERLKKLTESYVVSNLKIKESLEIDELPFSITEGLEITLGTFSENNLKERKNN